MTCSTLEKELELFRKAYQSVRVIVGSDDLVYKVSRGYSDKAAAKANSLIELMNLSLVAISTKFNAKDSFVVKSNEFE